MTSGTARGADATNRSYIPSLDGLRAVSILIVFVSHAGFGNLIPGGFGVTVFFFLSGFLITTLLTREWDRFGSIAQGAFYLRRIVRLGPSILVTLIFAIALALAGLVEGKVDLNTLMSQIFFCFNYYSIYAQNPAIVNGLGIFWSLAVEEHFYLVWPTLFILLTRRGSGSLSIILLLVAIPLWRAFRLFAWNDSEWVIYILTDTRFDSLLYGCLLAILSWRGQADRLFPATTWVRLSHIAGGLILVLASFAIRDDSFRSTLRYSVQGLALMPLFHYAVTRPRDLMFRPLNWAWVRKIGQWSYNLYLVHFVIIHALVFNGVAGWGTARLVGLSAALSIIYAALLYQLAEKPLHPLRRRLTGHRREPVAGGNAQLTGSTETSSAN